jgi:hypothetical protein
MRRALTILPLSVLMLRSRRFRVFAFGVLPAIGILLLASWLVLGRLWRRRGGHPEEARRAFYYWRTTLRLSHVEEEALSRLGVSRLYGGGRLAGSAPACEEPA